MKLITFNIQQGGGRRIESILFALNSHNADILAITEFQENAIGAKIKQSLYDNGFIHQASSTSNPKVNSVLVASKLSFSTILPTSIVGQHLHRVICAKFDSFNMIATYFPQEYNKRFVFDFLIHEGVPFLGNNGLIIGDFNTGKHYIDEPKTFFHCSEYMDKLEEASLIDSWRSRNDDVRQFSWYSNIGNGFRIDHVFSSKAFDDKITNVEYSHDERENKISHHSAFIVEFNHKECLDNMIF